MTAMHTRTPVFILVVIVVVRLVAGFGARAQPGQDDPDQPADRSLGRQATGRCEGV